MTVLAAHDHLAYEAAFWGDCTNTLGEELKQLVYARCMGLERSYYSFDVHGKRILDVGGGPVSLLLKTVNLRDGCVVDPIRWPAWVIERYAVKNIRVVMSRGEDFRVDGRAPQWDEVWIYNVLQHVEDPERVISRARDAAPVLRLFEWIDMPAYAGHPHTLTAGKLTEWIGSYGGVEEFKGESGCYGRAFFGVFSTT